jgi:hypothetical protein
VRALLLGRDNIVRFHATCSDRNGGLCALLRAQWRLEHLLPQTHITPAAGYDPTTDADTAWAVLSGHTLGDIPASSIIDDFVSGDPDTSVPRAEAVTRADNHAFAADLALHTQTLTSIVTEGAVVLGDRPIYCARHQQARAAADARPSSGGALHSP